MKRIAGILSPTSPVSPVLWYAVLGAPIAWALQFWTGYWLAQAQCGPTGSQWKIDLSAWATWVGIAGLAMAIGALATAVTLYRRTATAEVKGAPPQGRIKFLSVVGMTVAPLFIAIIAMTSTGVLVLLPCNQS